MAAGYTEGDGGGRLVTAEARASHFIKVADREVEELGFLLKEAAPGVFQKMRGWFGGQQAPAAAAPAAPTSPVAPVAPGQPGYPNPFMGGQRSQNLNMPEYSPKAMNARMKDQMRAQVGARLVGTVNALAQGLKTLQPIMLNYKNLMRQARFHFQNFQRMADVFRQQFPGDPLGKVVQQEYARLSRAMQFSNVDPGSAANEFAQAANTISQQFGYGSNRTLPDVRRQFPSAPRARPVSPGATPAPAAAPAVAPAAKAASGGDWYRLAQNARRGPQDFADRNILNDKIDDLKLITVTLRKLAKLAFQTQAGTRDVIRQVLDTKRLSNFPQVEKMVVEAERACLDSPSRVAELCEAAVAELVVRVAAFERDRERLVNKTMPDRWKGWRI